MRRAKALYGISFVPFVHDLIPVVAPEHYVDGLVRDFLSWISGVFHHADFFLVNSLATRSDLLRVAAVHGRTLGKADVAVVPLDADFMVRRRASDQQNGRAVRAARLDGEIAKGTRRGGCC